MKFLDNYKWLIGILLIAAALRFWQLGAVPTGPNWDEAALGYNAYSILKTGKDEYGTRFPLSLRSYDDYKPPLYMYLTVPSVALFGLNLWATRLPAVIAGLLAVAGTYFLARELMNVSPTFSPKKYLPYMASFLLAVSPWHIQFSRIAFEANIGVTLNIWAVLFFLWGIRKGRYFSISAFLFALSLYAYHSERIFAPLLVIILAGTFFSSWKKQGRAVAVAVIVGFITLAPLIKVLTDPTTLTRLRGTSSLSDQTVLLQNDVIKLQRDTEKNYLFGALIDNRRIIYAKTLFSGYLSHYSLNWLFISGDNARHHAPGMGLLYLIELPLLLLGIYAVARRGKKMGVVILGWMIVAPVAASPTTELPHAIRTLVFLPSFQIVVTAGIWQLLQLVSHIPGYAKKIVLSIFLLCALFNFLYYLDMYFIQQTHEGSSFWQYGYKQAVAYAQEHHNEYKKIVVSTKLEQPHMFFLFFLKYDPAMYLAQGGTASGGFGEVRNRFDIYEFRPIHWEKEFRDGSTLYIGKPGEIPVESMTTIRYLNGDEAIRIAR